MQILNVSGLIKASYREVKFRGTSDLLAKEVDADTFSLSAASSEAQPACNPQNATHLISVDFDGTLSTDLRGVDQFQRQFQNHLLHINTGRSIEDFASVGPLLKSVKVYALSTSNGEGLYINHGNLRGDRFVREIYEDYYQGRVQQDPEWMRQMECETGWRHQRVADIVRSFIKKELAEPGYGSTECVSGSSSVPLKILETLRQENINADFTVEDRNLYKFSPMNYEKADPVKFLASKCPMLTQVLVAGDSFNDKSLMRMCSARNANNTSVPVTRLLMDSNPAFVKDTLETAENPESITLISSFQEKLFEVMKKQYAPNEKPLPEMQLA